MCWYEKTNNCIEKKCPDSKWYCGPDVFPSHYRYGNLGILPSYIHREGTENKNSTFRLLEHLISVMLSTELMYPDLVTWHRYNSRLELSLGCMKRSTTFIPSRKSFSVFYHTSPWNQKNWHSWSLSHYISEYWQNSGNRAAFVKWKHDESWLVVVLHTTASAVNSSKRQ